ncbi:MAG: long-chain fatty acid--CoA ligase [Candidatus Thiosymbion ectosymbiont of Robbea hypermnestra]|nr:long-chain fatty acid--CoA ligase [Candidatus Thiosymbion ectosymbiont of Robbea hypermnestra]
MYIGDYLGRRALYSPDRTAIIDVGKEPVLRLGYRELDERANRLAGWLRAVAGVGKGDRVAILARDGVEHLDVFFACGKLGAVHTALNWRLHAKELAALIEKTRPKALVYSDDFQETARFLQRDSADRAYAIGHYLHCEGAGIPHSQPLREVLEQATSEAITCDSLDMEDTACLLFTGGTTGLPKGAMISHRMIAWNVLNTVIHDLRHEDIYLCVFPLFHAGGLFAYLSSQIILGNTSVLTRQFDPVQVLDLIEREKITIFAGVPTMYQALTQAPNWSAADLGSLRFCTSGGAPLPVPLVEQYGEQKGVRFKQGFGMTEFGPGLFALPAEEARRKAGSIGLPNYFIDARVMDDANRLLGPGAVGELVLKGPSRFSGYFGDPAQSAQVLDADGWFHTGDLVYQDEEGFFFVTDRKKDMYISGGENVYPTEIEGVLYRHPAVFQCAVIGVPDPRWGEVGMACVTLKPQATATEDELLAFLRDHLAAYKVPKHARVLEVLPLSGMGKILKRELKEQILADFG